MRKIKFRVVYKNEIQNLECPSDYRIDTSGRLVSYYDALETDMRHLNDDYYTQEYTGFKDIHGKEIYEGDTIKDSEWWVGRAEVKFRDGMFGFEADNRFVPLCELKNVEIIRPVDTTK